VGYEGDTCSFTCNIGYELTGSPQRTCQSDGSWSGSPVSCTIMECPSSSLPMNSMLAESCSSTYQSMCDLQCEEGFNGSGDPSHVCDVLSDGLVMWMTNGSGWNCSRGKHLSCPYECIVWSYIHFGYTKFLPEIYSIVIVYNNEINSQH